jgi:hypothetical protein
LRKACRSSGESWQEVRSLRATGAEEDWRRADELIAIERLTREIWEHQAALLSSNRGRPVRMSKRVADCGVDIMEAV